MNRLLHPSSVYRGWWIVATGFLAQMPTVGATGWVFGVLILPMQHDLGWSRTEVVGVVTLARLLSGFFAMKLGPLVDQHGARLLMIGSSVLAAASMAGTALIRTPAEYYACWVLFGLSIPGLSTLGPAVAISNWFVKKRTQALMVYTLGSAGAGLVLAPVMSEIASAVGWRTSWALMAVFFIIIAPLAWLTVRQRPEDYGLLPDGDEPDELSAIEEADSLQIRSVPLTIPEPAPEAVWTVRSALHSRAFWLLSLAFMLTSFPAASIFVHMSSFVQSKGFSSGAGAAAVSFYGVGVLLGRFIWGWAVERLKIYRALILFAAGYGVSIFLFVIPQTLPPIYATTVLLGISIAGSLQLNVQAFADYFGRQIVGTLLGYAGGMAAITGATAPLIAAAAFDRYDTYVGTFLVWAVLCLLGAVAFVFSRPEMPKVEPLEAKVAPARMT